MILVIDTNRGFLNAREDFEVKLHVNNKSYLQQTFVIILL